MTANPLSENSTPPPRALPIPGNDSRHRFCLVGGGQSQSPTYLYQSGFVYKVLAQLVVYEEVILIPQGIELNCSMHGIVCSCVHSKQQTEDEYLDDGQSFIRE